MPSILPIYLRPKMTKKMVILITKEEDNRSVYLGDFLWSLLRAILCSPLCKGEAQRRSFYWPCLVTRIVHPSFSALMTLCSVANPMCSCKGWSKHFCGYFVISQSHKSQPPWVNHVPLLIAWGHFSTQKIP